MCVVVLHYGVTRQGRPGWRHVRHLYAAPRCCWLLVQGACGVVVLCVWVRRSDLLSRSPLGREEIQRVLGSAVVVLAVLVCVCLHSLSLPPCLTVPTRARVWLRAQQWCARGGSPCRPAAEGWCECVLYRVCLSVPQQLAADCTCVCGCP